MGLSDRAITDTAHDTADELGELCRALDTGLLARITDNVFGPPATRWDGTHPAGGGGDPTAAAALAGRGTDRAGIARTELVRAVLRARAAVRAARQIADRFPETRPGDTAALARLNDRAEPGCESCARTTGPSGGPRWEPIDSRLAGPTTVAGRLPAAVWLCVWCTDSVRRWGRLPTPAELAAHHDGRRVRWPTDVPRPRSVTP